jgi:hypothetical protein
MPTINDWALKCAKRIKQEGKASEERIATIIAFYAEPLMQALRDSRRAHDEHCPAANPDYTYNVDEPCTCGADAWNAYVDAVLGGKRRT